MAEHDLWSEDDFFEKLKKEKKAADEFKSPEKTPAEKAPHGESLETDLFQKEDEPSLEEEIPAEEDIFAQNEDAALQQEEAFSEQEQEPQPDFDELAAGEDGAVDVDAQDFGAEVATMPSEEEPAAEDEAGEEPQEEPKKRYIIEDDYEDEKLAPVNYKPVIIGAVVVIALIALFFILRGMFFKKGTEGEQAAKTEQQTTAGQQGAEQKAAQQVNPLQQQQNTFLGQIAALNSANVQLIQNIQEAIHTQNSKLNSLLFYNDEITFEVKSKNRSHLAAVTMRLRNISGLDNLQLVSTEPQANGGISAVFHAKISTEAANGQPGTKLADESELQQWITMLAQQFSLKITAQQALGTASANFGLTRSRNWFRMQGTYDGCLGLVSALAAAKRNIKIRKLVLTATEKKKVYQIELTLDLFK
jgi:flagellar basal body-associated protein FliL